MGFFSEGVLIFQFFSRKLFFVKGFLPWFIICILDFSQGFFESFFSKFFSRSFFLFFGICFSKSFSLSFFSRVFFPSRGFFKFVIRVCLKIVFSSHARKVFFLLKVVFLLTVFVVETMTMTMRHSDKVFSRGSTLPYGREWRGRDFFNRRCKCFCFFQYMMFLQNVFFFFFIFTRSSTLPYGLERGSRGFIEKNCQICKILCEHTGDSISVCYVTDVHSQPLEKRG